MLSRLGCRRFNILLPPEGPYLGPLTATTATMLLGALQRPRSCYFYQQPCHLMRAAASPSTVLI